MTPDKGEAGGLSGVDALQISAKIFFFELILVLIFAVSCNQPNQINGRRSAVKTNSTIKFGFYDTLCVSLGQSQTKHELSLSHYATSKIKTLEDAVNTELESTLAPGITASADPKTYREIPNIIAKESPQVFPSKEAVTLNFEFEGINFCRRKISAHQDKGKLYYFGRLPKIPASALKKGLPVWPSLTATMDVLFKRMLKEPQYFGYQASDLDYDEQHLQRCIAYSEKKNQLIPYWQIKQLRFVDGSSPANITAILNDNGFLVDRGIEAYEENSFSNSFVPGVPGNVFRLQSISEGDVSYKVEDVEHSQIADSQFLCNSKFVTDLAKRNSTDDDFLFNQTTQSEELIQATLFFNATEHANWVENLNPSKGWYGGQVRISTYNPSNTVENERYQFGPNQALYNGLRNPPSITVGHGDGTELQNLSIDPDVISHEVGHHILHRRITISQGEPRVIHEAVADYFVAARNQSSCIAKTICTGPDSVFGCESGSGTDADSQCLRNIEKSMKYSEFSEEFEDQNGDVYPRSQSLSGTLWNIANELSSQGIPDPHRAMAQIIYQGIDYLTEDSGLREFFWALMLGDRDLNQAANACLIARIARERGFTQALAGVDCQQFSE